MHCSSTIDLQRRPCPTTKLAGRAATLANALQRRPCPTTELAGRAATLATRRHWGGGIGESGPNWPIAGRGRHAKIGDTGLQRPLAWHRACTIMHIILAIVLVDTLNGSALICQDAQPHTRKGKISTHNARSTALGGAKKERFAAKLSLSWAHYTCLRTSLHDRGPMPTEPALPPR